MPEAPVDVRIRAFCEVALGYTAELASIEASRCLQCKKPRCVEGCPVQIDIPAFVSLIAKKDFEGAARKLREYSDLPAVCGRVCPQEEQCEKFCVLGIKGKSVAIGRLERFAADAERAAARGDLPKMAPQNGKKVAIVGSGPAGLAAAGELLKRGYGVTIFEALHEAGGVLVYGIPEFRLPKAIVATEIEVLTEMGVRFVRDALVGKLYTIPELFDAGFSSVFLGTGAGLPKFMGIPGENLNGIYSANEFLTRVNLMKAYQYPNYDTPVKRGKRVAVIGGGNVAMDAARTALRLGAEKVTLVYRRGREEMPARHEEVIRAEEEGIEFRLLSNPVRYEGDQGGFVTHAICRKMVLGEPDASGRRSPVEDPASEFTIEADEVIVAIGTTPNPVIPRTTPGLTVGRHGEIPVNESGMTNIPGVFAGGDVVSGAATVITAMGAGKKAAAAMHAWMEKA